MLPSDYKPTVVEDLVRIGPDEDGGYVLPGVVVENTDLLLGFGVNDDWRFEEAFKAAASCDVVCFDHTVTSAWWFKRFCNDAAAFCLGKRRTGRQIRRMFRYVPYRRFFNGRTATHRRLMIGFSGESSKSIEDLMREYGQPQVFVKMDIEGWEYRVLDQIIAFPGRINGFAIEFHDVDLHRQRISDFIEAANDRYLLVHTHANNCGGTDAGGDPLVLEMTWVNRAHSNHTPGNELAYPLPGLDCSNKPGVQDWPLVFEQAAEPVSS